MSRKKHISICICTYKRPEFLERLMTALAKQETKGLFDYSIVVVDNDILESARSIIDSFNRKFNLAVSYAVQPEQNIALARNKTVANSHGNYVALIDDDEFPQDSWLLSLYSAINHYECDGILGPVLPFFDQDPPKWVIKGSYFDRPTHPTGHILEWTNTRTGNALLKRELFQKNHKWFDPAFGSGGEDRDFFRRMIELGNSFVWSNEAVVYETVPPSRWKRTVLLKRALLRGKMALNTPGVGLLNIFKSFVAIFLYTLCLPILACFGQHTLMKYLTKICDHLGKVFAFVGIDLVKEKYIGG